ncbi:hypothetical protein DUI87_26911 [Hirundo rustica rustica]|uniref:Uncharacterized protein n=1 Tax=Hirundo rustica rustica TaxID=333673 RepID=A0A3M0JD59_HIRRU|nr:hypothetical protein DUI87_26911 [Hirundo rustica rustica]
METQTFSFLDLLKSTHTDNSTGSKNSHHKEFSLLTEKGGLGHPGVVEEIALQGHTKGIFKPPGLPSSAKGKKAKPDTQHRELQLGLPKPGTPDRMTNDTLPYKGAWEEDGFIRDKILKSQKMDLTVLLPAFLNH